MEFQIIYIPNHKMEFYQLYLKANAFLYDDSKIQINNFLLINQQKFIIFQLNRLSYIFLYE